MLLSLQTYTQQKYVGVIGLMLGGVALVLSVFAAGTVKRKIRNNLKIWGGRIWRYLLHSMSGL